MPGINKLFWELRQLSGRLRDDARQLEDILYYHPDLTAPLDLIKIITGYWSEDPRIIDILMGAPILESITYYDLSYHDPDDNNHDIEIYASLRHICENHNSLYGVFTTQIVIWIEIYRFHEQINAIHWNSCNSLNALFILPEVNVMGEEVAMDYPEYTLASIAELRDELYSSISDQ